MTDPTYEGDTWPSPDGPSLDERIADLEDRQIAGKVRRLAGETLDPLVLEEPHHRAGRQLTDRERSVIADIRAKNRRREQQAAEERGQLDLGGAA